MPTKTKPKLNMTRPTTRAKAAPQNGKAKIVEGTTRLVVDMPTAIHRRLKLAVVAEGLTIREFILELLREKGIE